MYTCYQLLTTNHHLLTAPLALFRPLSLRPDPFFTLPPVWDIVKKQCIQFAGIYSSHFSLVSVVCIPPSSSTKDSMLICGYELASKRLCVLLLFSFFRLSLWMTTVPELLRQSLSTPTCRPERPSGSCHTETIVSGVCRS